MRLASGLRRVLPGKAYTALRARLLSMPEREARRVLRAIQDAGHGVVVFGGWGTDALLGRQSRRHGDLDLLIEARDEQPSPADEVMEALRYRFLHAEDVTGALFNRRLVWQDRRGHTVDLHPIDLDLQRRISPLLVTGAIAQLPVRCFGEETQLSLRQGYALRDADQLDLAALRSPAQPDAPGRRRELLPWIRSAGRAGNDRRG
jgi:lincosamide nucleotidyltransferase A/C/D/E